MAKGAGDKLEVVIRRFDMTLRMPSESGHMPDPLWSVSPLDGRYQARTEPLATYASEFGLLRARVHVEIEYLLALADLEPLPLALDADDRSALRAIDEDFDAEDAALIKQIETEGYGKYPATNHDVKAVEYFIRERLPADLEIDEWIHFGLTSEDVNNLAYRILLRDAVTEVIRPAIETVRGGLATLADRHRSLPMLARTHGQPATPTTFGKEMAVYADRLSRGLDRLDAAVDGLAGKLAGASGTYAAHVVAYEEIDWPAVSEAFVRELGLEHTPLATQINPSDDLAVLFDALRAVNRVLIDLDRDMWLYISQGYLGQAPDGEETGSSTMPHKVNPIDFENSEGNLSKANADLVFLGDYLTTSRLQRDLSDSTVKRNIGAALAHALIGYTKTSDGLGVITPNEAAMREDLEAHPEVLAEAVQTILRREGHADAYERVKAATRAEAVRIEELRALLEDIEDLPELSPAAYTGLAEHLVEKIGE